MQNKIIKTTAALLFALLVSAAHGEESARKIRVVTTTSDLAYIAAQVGGERVEASALLRGSDDPHYARARPDFIVKLNRADVFVEVGLELEAGWSPLLLRNARNAEILPGARGYCDASVGVRILERPKGRVTRAMGDVHALGNPHYWTDPLNAAIIARNIRDALTRVDPSSRATYQQNYETFHARLKMLTVREAGKMRALPDLKVAVYHREFAYLAHRFGFETPISIEELPGVPPSASYLKDVVERMRAENIRVILVAPFNNQNYAQSVAEQVPGAKVVVMPLSVGSIDGVDTYEQTIETMLARLRAAVAGS